MDRDRLLQWGATRIEKGLRIDTKVLAGYRKKEIREAFSSHKNFIEALGILDEYKEGKHRKGTGIVLDPPPKAWTKESLIEWAKAEHLKGNQLNYNYIDTTSNHLIRIINKHFGSHKQFILEAGLPYDAIAWQVPEVTDNAKKVRVSIETAQLGYKFEELLGQLFTDMGRTFTKYQTETPSCEPDFIFSADYWADAKLSVTLDTVKMRKKYLQHCNRLSVFHLIGSHDYEAVLKDGTERISIFTYLKKLDKTIQDKYLPLFLEMEQDYRQTVA